jgi:hypothetical protein
MPTPPPEPQPRCSYIWAYVTPAALMAVILALSTLGVRPEAASAATDPLSWSAPVRIEQSPEVPLMALSCPFASLCVAVDLNGNVLTSTNPTGGASAWTTALVDEGSGPLSSVLNSISCPTTTFCVGTDTGGNVVVSTNPTGGASAWTTTNVTSSLDRVSCPSSTFCAAISYSGDVLTSTDPTGGVAAWHAASIDAGNGLTSIACASAALCVAVDFHGNVISSTNPTGGASAWSTPEEIAALANETPEPLNEVVCPTTSFCAATDGYDYLSYEGYSIGNVVVSTNPTGGASAWRLSPVIAGSPTTTGGLFHIACPLAGYCLTTDLSAQVLTVESSGETFAWTTANIESVNYSRTVSGIACPSTELCIAVDTEGNVLVGTPSGEEPPKEEPKLKEEPHHEQPPLPPVSCCDYAVIRPVSIISAAQIKALLASQLTPSGKTATISSLLKHGGLTLSFTAPEAGTLAVQWYQVPTGAKLAKKTKAKPVLVASGKLTFSGAGTGKVKVTLTAQGKKLLRHTKRLTLTAKATFTPSGGTAASITSGFQVKRAVTTTTGGCSCRLL